MCREDLYAHCAHCLWPLGPATFDYLFVVSELRLHCLTALVVAGRGLDVDCASAAICLLFVVERIGAHIDVIVAGKGQVHSVLVKEFAPSGYLRVCSVCSKEPLVVLADNYILGRIALDNALEPLLRILQSLLCAHRLVIEHYEECLSILEPIADSHLSRIPVKRVGGGVSEILVGKFILATHIVVIAVNSGPHIISEPLHTVEIFPERVTSAPRAYISKMKNPVH